MWTPGEGEEISQCALTLKVVAFYISVCGLGQQVLQKCYHGPREIGHCHPSPAPPLR